MKKDRFIQVSRIIACFGVCAVHLGNVFNDFPGGEILSIGRYGLFIFFVLSGYLACNWDGNGKKQFLLKKLVRLMPLCFAVLACYFIFYEIILRESHGSIFNWVRYLLGVNAWIPSRDIFWKSMHANWYVSVLWGFYVLHSMIWNKIKERSDTWYCVSFAVGCVLAMLIVKYDSMWSVNAICFLQFFILGMAAHKMKSKKSAILVAIAIVCYCIKPCYMTRTIIIASIYAFVLACLCDKFYVDKPGKLCAVLDFLDEQTYAVYLTHPFVIDFGVKLIREYVTNMYIAFLIAVICICVIAFLTHFLFEKPVQVVLKRYLLPQKQ